MIPARPHPQARLLVPEVVQTSVMDCGPASLQSLVQGFGLSVNYGRLREACQTGVDGTSITMIDEIGKFLGLETEEMMLPQDHLLLAEAHALPAILVVRNPDSTNHFVVVWSIVGPWIQVMDPGEGRHWARRSVVLDKALIHTATVPAEAWRAWVGEREFQDALHVRLGDLEVGRAERDRLIAQALADPTWEAMAALDAAVRMTAAMVRCGAVPRSQCLALISGACEPVAGDVRYPLILGEYRSAWRKPDAAPDDDTIEVRGVVIVRVRGVRGAGSAVPATAGGAAPAMPPELATRLNEAEVKPGKTLLGMLLADGIATPLVLAMVLIVSAALVTVDAILLRGFLEVGSELGLPSQRAAAVIGMIGVLAIGLVVELPLTAGALRLGRALDLRLRLAFLTKIPRLDDRYFRSRLLSDMAERGHSLHIVRALPLIGVRLLASSTQLLLTVAGIAWLQPASAPLALITAVLCIALPLVIQPVLAERELRVRAHAGALGRFYLDALLGLLPIRVHGARPAMQRQQEALLVQWVKASLRFHGASTVVEGVLALSGLVMAVLMVRSVSSHSASGLLLLVYWALSLPALGQDIAIVARQYPTLRNVVARLLEPLSTPEPEPVAVQAGAPVAPPARAAHVVMSGVTVEAGGNLVLEGVDLELRPGDHVAVVGASGAGKSSLVGLLLGWYRASVGSVAVDGRELVGDWLSAVRRDTAWVDPAVTLWNRSFLENLRYGAVDDAELPLAEILSRARLREVLEHLPDGLATELGEGGGMVSGGEGQRTRVGRALARKHARLVILDEPFRGLDLKTRRELMAMARDWWKDATLVWVTHDIAETESFARVLVLDAGKLVEDGAPAVLAATPGSRYAQLATGDRAMHQLEWSGDRWRKIWMTHGKVREEGPS
jgi:ATP-binding cassette subfamily B protein